MCCVSFILIAINKLKIKNDSMTRNMNVYVIVFVIFEANEHIILTYYLILILMTLWKMLSISSPGQSIFSSLIQYKNPSINEP